MASSQVSREQAINLCSQSIRRMLDSYQKHSNPKWPSLIRKRIRLKKRLRVSGKQYFTRQELGLIDPVELMQHIASVSALIVRTNRFTHGQV